jgi:tetratricopeptide (TPR) repeat protein
MLSDKGLLYIGLPTIDRIDYPTIDQLFKEDHINMFTRASLEYFLNTQGFEVVYQNTYLYGTAVICKKKKTKSTELKTFYPQHKELLKKIYDYYQFKKQAEELMGRDMPAAKQATAQALQAFSESPEMIIKFASMNDPIDEQDILAEYIKLKPEMYELIISKGISHFKDQDHDAAEKCFLDAMEICGSMPMCLNHLGQIAYHKKDYKKAVDYMLKNLEMEPHNLSVFEMLANFLMLY